VLPWRGGGAVVSAAFANAVYIGMPTQQWKKLKIYLEMPNGISRSTETPFNIFTTHDIFDTI
jgi:hypothetical protein